VSANTSYVGRFAPSPSGPLHRGSLVAAMASYLDARAHGGRWLLRIEDIDQERSRAEASEQIIADLSKLGFQFEPDPWYQSRRGPRYQLAFDRLQGMKRVYACICSRKEIEGSPVYPGTCRKLFEAGQTPPRHALRAWRLKLDPALIEWQEGGWLRPTKLDDKIKRGGGVAPTTLLSEEITTSVGDFVIARPGPSSAPERQEWTYQLSVVVDDEEAGVTHVVRGMDLLESTSRQIYLQTLLGYRRLHYWHCPLVLEPSGQKLSKQNGAQAINTNQALPTLNQALLDLGLTGIASKRLSKLTLTQFWEAALAVWCEQMLSSRVGH
jgi:glutamyl-Q tRNA(Asp) synthetase